MLLFFIRSASLLFAFAVFAVTVAPDFSAFGPAIAFTHCLSSHNMMDASIAFWVSRCCHLPDDKDFFNIN
jgi:hypothetical protein